MAYLLKDNELKLNKFLPSNKFVSKINKLETRRYAEKKIFFLVFKPVKKLKIISKNRNIKKRPSKKLLFWSPLFIGEAKSEKLRVVNKRINFKKKSINFSQKTLG